MTRLAFHAARLSFGALLLAAAVPAKAESKLQARYAISVAGIAIGTLDWSVDVGHAGYSSTASGRASGILGALVSGEGAVSVRGAIKDGRPAPESFTASVIHDNDKSDVKMVLAAGDVKDVTAETQKPAADRVPLTPAHRHGVIDPASAMLIPMPAAFETAGKDTCRRTLPIFDGRRRYDLKLSFRRMDQVKAQKGYAGAVVVCVVAFFQPQAGHRASSKLVRYLSGGRDIEIWFAPVRDAHLMAPFRASVASMVGNLVVEATEFDVRTETAAVR
jgi:hypothetical protein